MTSAESARSTGHVTWDGTSAAVGTIRDLLVVQASTGVLRLVLQQLTLREHGREVGVHESMDAIVDVGGNLVVVPIGRSVRADPAVSARLDAALAQLRDELRADLGAPVDSLEMVSDADGTRRVMLLLHAEVSPQEIADGTHPALHGGAFHIRHHAPALEDLRDRLSAPPPGLMERLRARVRGAVRGRPRTPR